MVVVVVVVVVLVVVVVVVVVVLEVVVVVEIVVLVVVSRYKNYLKHSVRAGGGSNINGPSEMYLRDRAYAHGVIGHRIDPSWWTL